MDSRRETGERLGAGHYLIIIGCWLLLGLFSATRLQVNVPHITWKEAWLYGLPDGLLWAVLTPIPVIVARRFPLPAPRVWRNVAIHFLVGTAVAVGHTQLDALQNELQNYVYSVMARVR